MTAAGWLPKRRDVLRRTHPPRHGDEWRGLRWHRPSRRAVEVTGVVVGVIVLVMVAARPQVAERVLVQERATEEDEPEEPPAAQSSAAAVGMAATRLPVSGPRRGDSATDMSWVWPVTRCGWRVGAGLGTPLARDPSPPRIYHFQGTLDATLFEFGAAPRSGQYVAEACGPVDGQGPHVGSACVGAGARTGRAAVSHQGNAAFEASRMAVDGGPGRVRLVSALVSPAVPEGEPEGKPKGTKSVFEHGWVSMLVELPAGSCRPAAAVPVSAAGTAYWGAS